MPGEWRNGAKAAAMRPPILLRCMPLPLLEGWGQCVLYPNLGYNQANETAAEDHSGYDSDLDEASMRDISFPGP